MYRLIFGLLGITVLLAQSSGGLTGTVTDPAGGRLQNVEIIVINEGTGFTQNIKTNAQGDFSLVPLPPGQYVYTAELSGFQRYRQIVVLETGRVIRVDVALTVGQVSSTVDVNAETPLLESETATVGQFIENKTVKDMPLNGRRVGELLKLMGNAVFISGDVIRPRVSVAGSRGDQQQWVLDGANASNVALEIPQALFNPPVESVEEVRIQQNNYSAEFGNSAGGVVNITTKSGTNQWHGVGYEYFRNDALDARSFFSAQKPKLRYNIFGFAVGGPIIKNKTFFFTSNEWQKQRQGLTRLFTVPTDLQKAGNFSQTLNANGTTAVIYDPATTRPDPNHSGQYIRDAFAGNIIPANRIDPVAAKIIENYPLANRAAANLAGANNFGRNAVNNLNITTSTTKVDHILNESSRVSFRMVIHDFPTSTTSVFDQPAADPNATVTDRRAYSFLTSWVKNFGSRSVNEVRVNFQPRRFRSDTYGIDGNWPSKLGLKGVSELAFPQVIAAGYTNLGNGTQQRIQTPISDTHIVDVYSYLVGRHNFRMGGEFRRGRNVDDLNSLASGSLSFGTLSTSVPLTAAGGNSIASLLLGLPLSGQILDTDILDRRSNYYAAFFQDDWKVTSNLTLNLGVRWEAHSPRVDARNRQNSFDLETMNPVSGTPGVVTFAGQNGLGREVYRGNYANFAPRIGLAWKPLRHRNLLIRSGYGIYFGPPVPGSNTASAGYETSGAYSSPDNGITAPFILQNGFPSTSRPVLDAGYGAVSVGQPVKYAPVFIGQDRKLGYSQQWNFSVQQELAGNIILEAAYLGNVGHRLPAPNTNINQIQNELLGSGNAQIRRPFPQFGNVTLLAPMWGNSSYHGLNLKAEKRFSNGLNFLGNYTWSKFIDDVASDFEVGAVPAGYQDFYNRRADRALSGNDVRHRFVASSVYELPIGKGRKWLAGGFLGKAVGGWNIGTIITAQAGSPYGLTVQNSTSNSFSGGPQRVNILRNPSLPADERSVSRYFDTSAVSVPSLYTFGNSSRSLLTGPGLFTIDASLLKNTPIGEWGNVQFRAEAFNIANRANFQEPGRALGAANFGVISDALPARVLQLGIKVEF